ncbi:jg3185 [Pararge aegeria aegeria]|uniref:Jg3185 protein n=1 Tax=Pararge aegeria aegeria TaxID=348720 RepID=A0A8S4QXJ9_9NEOP|nr:jg3185 [Pararge aegeria aegeria]
MMNLPNRLRRNASFGKESELEGCSDRRYNTDSIGVDLAKIRFNSQKKLFRKAELRSGKLRPNHAATM